ncbi:hypothetical protein ALC56_03207 [Trachymyrmex septentrionalis]|uniref:Uncharacterized protein n=1 Tax=Trachymyrmex septentrionalis TaxID=34720 RepID=A0A195FQ73_9HYME|nr:hypothetical protein ALC56_03207 [Trachymyrmex septentrionalis]
MHVGRESGQSWSCGGKEKKNGKMECRWFTVIKYRRTHARAFALLASPEATSELKDI